MPGPLSRLGRILLLMLVFSAHLGTASGNDDLDRIPEKKPSTPPRGSVPPSPTPVLTEARIALHASALPAKNPCGQSPNSTNTPCSAYVTQWPTGSPAYVYLAAISGIDSTGVLGVSCGIDYVGGSGFGLDPNTVTWTRCSDGLEYPNDGPNGTWPNPGGGNRITWLTCQQQAMTDHGVHAIAGFLYCYAYSTTTLRVTKNENLLAGSEAVMATCQVNEGQVDSLFLGAVGFGQPGFNPCAEQPPAGCPGCPDNPPGCNDGITSSQILVTNCDSCRDSIPQQPEVYPAHDQVEFRGLTRLRVESDSELAEWVETADRILGVAGNVTTVIGLVIPQPSVTPFVQINSIDFDGSKVYVGDIGVLIVNVSVGFGAVTDDPSWHERLFGNFIPIRETQFGLGLSIGGEGVWGDVIHNGAMPRRDEDGFNRLGPGKTTANVTVRIPIELARIGAVTMDVNAWVRGGAMLFHTTVFKHPVILTATDVASKPVSAKEPFPQTDNIQSFTVDPSLNSFEINGGTHGVPVTARLRMTNYSSAKGGVKRPRLQYDVGELAHQPVGWVEVPANATVDVVSGIQVAHDLFPDTTHVTDCHFCLQMAYDKRRIYLTYGTRVGTVWNAKYWYAGKYSFGGCFRCRGTGAQSPQLALAASAHDGTEFEPNSIGATEPIAAMSEVVWTGQLMYEVADSLFPSPGGDTIQVVNYSPPDTTTFYSSPDGSFAFSGSVGDSCLAMVKPFNPWLYPVRWEILDPQEFASLPDSTILLPRNSPIVRGRVLGDEGYPLTAAVDWILASGDTIPAGVYSGEFRLHPFDAWRHGGDSVNVLFELIDAESVCATSRYQMRAFDPAADSVDVGDVLFGGSEPLPAVVVHGIVATADSSALFPIPGLHLVFSDPAHGITEQASTDLAGEYDVSLFPGTWLLTVSDALYKGYCWPTLAETILVSGCSDSLFLPGVLEEGPCDSLQTDVRDPLPGRHSVWVTPNPARGAVLIGVAGFEKLTEAQVIDVAGRRIKQMSIESPSQLIRWDGRDDAGRITPGGLYFIRVRGDGETLTRKFLLLK